MKSPRRESAAVDRDRPIGVFDSGIGGLTVFKALERRMPAESLAYFGDTAHVPYGSKSREAVTRYSLAVARFLEGLRVKALVVACNTSSALALCDIRKALRVPVIGVIHPGARAAAAATASRRIGIIGTEATVASGAYPEALKEYLPGAFSQGSRQVLLSVACPLFVPLVEEGWWRHPVAEAVAREYLGPLRGQVDTLILGCTHYPLLKGVLRRVMGPGVRLIDSAEHTAIEAESLLGELKLRRCGGRGERRFFVSDAPARFLRLARVMGVAAPRVAWHRFD